MKYLAFTAIAFRQSLAEKGATLGRAAFYGIILLVFSRVWLLAHEHPLTTGTNPVDMLWYLAITEWIVLSIPYLHMEIEKDVRNGNIAYLTSRPVSYAWVRLFEGFGMSLLRLIVLGVAGFGYAWLLSGDLPSRPSGLWLALPLGLLSVIVALAFQVVIGLSAFWLQDANPLYWVWQKFSFILGGLILPLSLYPDWLREIAMLTPFPPMLYGLATAVLDSDAGAALQCAGLLALWGTLVLLLMEWAYRRGMRVLTINGG